MDLIIIFHGIELLGVIDICLKPFFIVVLGKDVSIYIS